MSLIYVFKKKKNKSAKNVNLSETVQSEKNDF